MRKTDPEMTQIIELVDKDIKIVIMTVFCRLKKLQEDTSFLTRNGKKTTGQHL